MSKVWTAPDIAERTTIVAQLSVQGGGSGSGGGDGGVCKCPPGL